MEDITQNLKVILNCLSNKLNISFTNVFFLLLSHLIAPDFFWILVFSSLCYTSFQ